MTLLPTDNSGLGGPRVRPPRPYGVEQRLAPLRSGFPAPVRRFVKRALGYATDRGWLGLTPLQTHVVVCGFPRSGATLLLLMVETAYPKAKTFHRERFALREAEANWLGRHEVMFTKKPDDIYWIDEVRAFYASRPTTPRFVVCVRDPRAVLTSVHPSHQGYYVSTDRWRSIYSHYLYVRDAKDVQVVDFADLVQEPDEIERRFSTFVGRAPARPFGEFYRLAPEGFSTRPLPDGVRALDPDKLEQWRAPRHRERLRSLLVEMPDLPQILVDMGYEPDTEWLRDYR